MEGFMGKVEDVQKIVNTISAIKKYIDELNVQNSVIVSVANYTDYVFELVWSDHSSGGFGVNPFGEIPANSVNVFGSVEKGGAFLTGAIGKVFYRMKSDPDICVLCEWSNPQFGKNEGDMSIFKINRNPKGMTPVPLPVNELKPWYSVGSGNKSEARFEIRAA